jgi:UDP-N-acetylmuramyl pentapeptide phosphotransferase/UDP-N-acetylglucosamine-1-phosphate transferase
MTEPEPLVWAAVLVAGCASLSAVLIFFFRPLLVQHLMAHPNARSSHKTPTPQGAGLAVMLSVFAGVALAVMTAPPLSFRFSSSLAASPSSARSTIG